MKKLFFYGIVMLLFSLQPISSIGQEKDKPLLLGGDAFHFYKNYKFYIYTSLTRRKGTHSCGLELKLELQFKSESNHVSTITDTISPKKLVHFKRLMRFLRKNRDSIRDFHLHFNDFIDPPVPFNFFIVRDDYMIDGKHTCNGYQGEYDGFVVEHANTFKEKVFYSRLRRKARRASKEAFRYFYKRHKALMDSLKVN